MKYDYTNKKWLILNNLTVYFNDIKNENDLLIYSINLNNFHNSTNGDVLRIIIWFNYYVISKARKTSMLYYYYIIYEAFFSVE